MVEFKGKEKTIEAFEKFLEAKCKVNVGNSNSLRDKDGKHLMPSKQKLPRKPLKDEL